MMPPSTAPMLDPPVLPYRPAYARCADLRVGCRHRLRLRRQHRRAVRMRDRLVEIGSLACPARPAAAAPLRRAGCAPPGRCCRGARRCKSDTARTLDCAANSAWSNARLSRSAASRSSATLASSRSSSASAWVNLVNAPNGSAVPALCASATALTAAVAGGTEFLGVRGVALRQLASRGLDAVLDVGDRRRQGGDRAVDVGRRAVDTASSRVRA